MKQTKQAELAKEIKNKLRDLIYEYDLFMDIPNSIIASSEAEKYFDSLLEIIAQAQQEAYEKGVQDGYKSASDGETQLERVVRRSHDGDFSNDFTITISRLGFSLTRVGVKPRGLTRVAKNLSKTACDFPFKELKDKSLQKKNRSNL